jgi:hypothetical protein
MGTLSANARRLDDEEVLDDDQPILGIAAELHSDRQKNAESNLHAKRLEVVQFFAERERVAFQSSKYPSQGRQTPKSLGIR